MAVEKKPNVLFLTSWYPNKLQPALGNFVQQHAKAVSKYCNVSVLFAAADPDLKDKRPQVEYTEDEGIPTARCYYPAAGFRIPFLTSWRQLEYYLHSLKEGLMMLQTQQGSFDILHVPVPYKAGIAALRIKELQHLPYLVTEHWTGYYPEDGRYKGIVKPYTQKIIQKARAITVVAERQQEMMQHHGLRGDYYTTPNVVDTNLFKPGNTNPRQAEKKQLLHVSSLDDHQKNITGLLKAIKEVAKERQDFELLLVGNGTDRQKLEALADKMELLGKQVKFLGAKTHKEIAKLLQNSVAFVLFSNYENQPCVILEALACGTPVISTRVGGISKMVDAASGKLITRGDEATFAKAIINVLKEDPGFNPQRMHALIKETNSAEVVGNQMKDIYQRILQQNK